MGDSLRNRLTTFRQNVTVSRFEMSSKIWAFRKFITSPLHWLEIPGSHYRMKPRYIANERNFSYTAGNLRTFLLIYLLTYLLNYLLHGAESLRRSPVLSSSRNAPHFMEPEVSLPLHPVRTPTSHFWRSILILSSHLRLGLPGGLFSSGIPLQTPEDILCLVTILM